MTTAAPSPAVDSPEAFAADLRALRRAAGDPTLAALSARTGISKSVLSEALTGRRLPTERTVVKLVEAFTADPGPWIARRGSLASRAVASSATQETADPADDGARPGWRSRRLALWQTLAIAAASAALAAVGTSAFFLGGSHAQASLPPGENASGPYLAAANGVDPMRTACKEDAIIAASEPRFDRQVQVQLLYSNDCMAMWGRVTRYDGASSGNTLTMRVYPADDPDGARSQERSAGDLQSIYTPMIVEPDVDARICGVATLTIDGEIVDLGPALCG